MNAGMQERAAIGSRSKNTPDEVGADGNQKESCDGRKQHNAPVQPWHRRKNRPALAVRDPGLILASHIDGEDLAVLLNLWRTGWSN
jgi:hypothetical protein